MVSGGVTVTGSLLNVAVSAVGSSMRFWSVTESVTVKVASAELFGGGVTVGPPT